MDRLEALHAFVRLVEIGSFSKVGTELRVKQSTVSKWLATLEEQLGAQLIERTSREQRVTEPGMRFYQRAKEILAAYEEAEAELSNSSPRVSGRLRVSLPVVFGRLHVVPLLSRFARRHSELELDLVFDDRYVRLLEEGFDVAIRVGVPVDSTLRSKTLAVTARHLVASKGYLTRAAPLCSPHDLVAHACLLHTGLEERSVWRFEKNGKTVRARVGGRFGANNSEAVLAMARAGHGIALLASWLVDRDLARGKLVRLLPDFVPPAAPIQALTPPSRYMHPRVRAFLDFMAESLRSLA